MRTPIIAGNWKMFKTIAEAGELVRQMRNDLNAIEGVDKVLCPPFTALAAVAELVRPTRIRVGGALTSRLLDLSFVEGLSLRAAAALRRSFSALWRRRRARLPRRELREHLRPHGGSA